MESLVNIGIIISYILMAVAVLGALVLPLIYFIKNFNFKKAKNSFIGIGILIVVFLITYATSSGDAGLLTEKFGVSAAGFKLIGGSIVLTYILTVCAFLIAVYTEASIRIK